MKNHQEYLHSLQFSSEKNENAEYGGILDNTQKVYQRTTAWLINLIMSGISEKPRLKVFVFIRSLLIGL